MSRLSEEVVLQLPLDFALTPSTRTKLESFAFEWDTRISEALLSAVFGVQLFRYSGQARIPITASRVGGDGGVIRATRLGLEISGDSTLRELLSQVEAEFGLAPVLSARSVLWGAAASGPQAAVTWIEDGGPSADLVGVLARSTLKSREADLHLVVSGTGRSGIFLYNSSLFAGASVERFAGHLKRLVSQAIARDNVPLSRLGLLSESEKQWLEEVSSGRPRTLTRTAPGELVFRRIEHLAEQTPRAIAVRHRDQSLTYSELNARANQLAHFLQEQGIGAESRVVVCVEPAFDIVVAILGIFKAGAVYVPLEPTYPPARIRAILDDTAPGLIISRGYLIERLGLTGHPLLDLSAPELERLSRGNPDLPVAPTQTAYIYYTSGTTGTPKGVMASHANLMFYLGVSQERYGFTDREVMPAIARFSFSISMFELLSPLVAGGQLVILDRDHVLDLERMSQTMSEVTFFHAGPSLLKNLLPYIRRKCSSFEAYAGVRHASSGGDMVAPELLEELKAIFSNAEVFVIYGCSEISCMGCTYPVSRETVITKTYVGRPFEGTTVRVLDGSLNQQPAGIVGEIHFSGDGVVKGYLNRAELTAEKFVSIEGRRFYRTGDLGRLSADGWLEILGRNDFQIKVRGMRIELGEVEHCLRKAPGVREGVVMAKNAADGEKVLVAYVVSNRGAGTSVQGDESRRRMAAIRRHMAENVPDYMVPALYVELEAMPLNANMKLDRHRLPEPEQADQRRSAQAAARAPRTATEKGLAELWKKLLRLDRIGFDDNFFELGGHSLLAMEFIGAAQKELGVTLEGMDVLRESLEVLAALGDEQLGRKSAPLAYTPDSRETECTETFHFGRDQALFGVLRRAGRAPASEAVLICSPLGQELVRTHFILNRLSKVLVAQGVPVMRFDYYGCWDSLGESGEASCTRWQSDIVEAYDELKRRTGAARVVGVGVRLGATLLCSALARVALSRLVLWDPVGEGAEFYAEQSEMHRKYLRSTRHLRSGGSPRSIRGAEELLGSTYSDLAVRELKGLSIQPGQLSAVTPLRWLITSQRARQEAVFRTLGGERPGWQSMQLDFDSGWNELSQLDDVLPDVGIAHALAGLVREEK